MKGVYVVYFVGIQLLLVVVFVAKYSIFQNFTSYGRSIDPCNPEINVHLNSIGEKEDRSKLAGKHKENHKLKEDGLAEFQSNLKETDKNGKLLEHINFLDLF